MHLHLRSLKYGVSAILMVCSMATFALSQIITSGPKPPPEFTKAVDQFNADVKAWNERCKVTRTAAEDAWCKKERIRIDAKKAELVRLGAIPR